MHTQVIGAYSLHHNGDYSGDVIIYKGSERVCEVPFDVLKSIVAGYVRAEKIATLEKADDDDLLFGFLD